MKQRPLLFIIIGILHLLEPLIKLFYFKVTTPFEVSTILTNISKIGPVETFEFWFLFPIGGLALLGVKKWSYPVFVSVQAYSIYTHIFYEQFTWPYVSKVPFYSSIVLLAINLVIIAYFFLPSVRKPFFDKSMRWWEHRKRYNFKLPCTVSILNPDDLHDCDVLNISLSGAFINYNGVVEVGQRFTINLSYLENHISVESEVVSAHSFTGERGVGVKFNFKNIYENLQMRKIIKEVNKASKKQEKLLSAA